MLCRAQSCTGRCSLRRPNSNCRGRRLDFSTALPATTRLAACFGRWRPYRPVRSEGSPQACLPGAEGRIAFNRKASAATTSATARRFRSAWQRLSSRGLVVDQPAPSVRALCGAGWPIGAPPQSFGWPRGAGRWPLRRTDTGRTILATSADYARRYGQPSNALAQALIGSHPHSCRPSTLDDDRCLIKASSSLNKLRSSTSRKKPPRRDGQPVSSCGD